MVIPHENVVVRFHVQKEKQACILHLAIALYLFDPAYAEESVWNMTHHKGGAMLDRVPTPKIVHGWNSQRGIRSLDPAIDTILL